MRRQFLGCLWDWKWSEQGLWYLDSGPSRYSHLVSVAIVTNQGDEGLQIIVGKASLIVAWIGRG